MSASVSVILVIFALLCIDQNEGLILYRDRYRDRYGKIRGRKSLLVNLKLKRFRICFVWISRRRRDGAVGRRLLRYHDARPCDERHGTHTDDAQACHNAFSGLL